MSDSDSLPELLTPSQWNAENNGRYRGGAESSSSSDNESESSDDESDNDNSGDDIAQAIFSRYLATAFAAHLRDADGGNSDDDEEDEDSASEGRCPGCPNCQPGDGHPRLVRLLRTGDWAGALKRMETNSNEINWVDEDDEENILHVALSSPSDNGFVPLNVVKKIVDKNKHGSDIIEMEVRTGDESYCNVFDIIFSSLPEPEDKSGLRLRRDVIVYLASECPDMVEAAIEKFFERMFAMPRVLEEAAKSISLETDLHDIPGHLNFVLSLADQLLYIKEYGPRNAKEKPFKFFLHTAMSCLDDSYHVSTLFYRLAISACRREKWHTWDHLGRTPLSIAIGAKSFITSDTIRESITGLIKIAPSNTRMMCDDATPLHYAIRKKLKWNDGMKEILTETPNALCTRDIKTRLYPFMHAAVGHSTDLNTVFMLLQQDPLLARGLADMPPWQKIHNMKVENHRLNKQNILLEALVNDYVAKEDMQDREIEELKRVIEQLTREKDIAMKGEYLD